MQSAPIRIRMEKAVIFLTSNGSNCVVVNEERWRREDSFIGLIGRAR